MSQADFIVPPPGLVPDAPEPETPERTVQAPDRLPAFRPTTPVVAPPGAARPAPPSPPVPPIAPIAPAAPIVPAAPAASTARARPRAWRLRSADGVEFVVRDRVVAGRDPQLDVVTGGATPVAIVDPLRSMSKTHALLEVDGDRLVATDLQSTNGVRIWPDGRDPVELEPGVPTPVPADAVLLLGDVAFLADLAPDVGS
ncbi:FHA domain-containing protein [Agromyces sp. NPDC056523]|uniref:FHA domain-containing protein n=1 Tax=Agromyces sp. NPDC056523 TaxID=3345850 RepID=UPI00367157BC